MSAEEPEAPASRAAGKGSLPAKKKAKLLQAAKEVEEEAAAEDEDGDFEVVPQSKDDSDGESSDEDDELDYLSDDAKAEILAIAKKMLRRKVRVSGLRPGCGGSLLVLKPILLGILVKPRHNGATPEACLR